MWVLHSPWSARMAYSAGQDGRGHTRSPLSATTACCAPRSAARSKQIRDLASSAAASTFLLLTATTATPPRSSSAHQHSTLLWRSSPYSRGSPPEQTTPSSSCSSYSLLSSSPGQPPTPCSRASACTGNTERQKRSREKCSIQR